MQDALQPRLGKPELGLRLGERCLWGFCLVQVFGEHEIGEPEMQWREWISASYVGAMPLVHYRVSSVDGVGQYISAAWKV